MHPSDKAWGWGWGHGPSLPSWAPQSLCQTHQQMQNPGPQMLGTAEDWGEDRPTAVFGLARGPICPAPETGSKLAASQSVDQTGRKWACEFPRTDTNGHTPGSSEQQKLNSHSPEARSPQTKLSAGLVLLRGSGGATLPCLSPSFCWGPAILGLLCLCLSSHHLLCVSGCLLVRTLVIGFRSHPISKVVSSQALSLKTSPKIPFPNKFTS